MFVSRFCLLYVKQTAGVLFFEHWNSLLLKYIIRLSQFDILYTDPKIASSSIDTNR